MIATSHHTNACFEAWMRCEDLLVNISQVQNTVSKKITKVIDECAMICMTTFHALKSKSINATNYAVLCMGICEECAELCDALNDANFRHCARVCRQCSDTMSALAFTGRQ